MNLHRPLKTAKRRKSVIKAMKRENRFHGLPRHVAQIYRAVENYVYKNNGTVVVIGGIQVIQFVSDSSEFKYIIGVSCSGRKPEFPKP